MYTLRPLILRFSIITLLSMACVPSITMGQAMPSSLSDLAKKGVLSTKDEGSVKAFAEYHGQNLTSDDAGTRSRARQKLMADLQGLSGQRATPSFREYYAIELMPILRSAISDGTIPQAIAATQVAGVLGTDSAVTTLSRHLSQSQEPREAVRVWAAASLLPLVVEPNVTASRLTRAMSDLGRAATTEPSWPALRKQLETIAAAVNNTRTQEEGRDEIMRVARTEQARLMAIAIKRLGDGDLDMLMVITPHLQHVQQQFLDQDSADALNALAKSMVPVLTPMYGSILSQWDAIRADDQATLLGGRSLEKAEVLVVLMNNYLTDGNAAASPKYQQALARNQKDVVEAGQARWGSLGSSPPYTN
jgi:hypothetical protein